MIGLYYIQIQCVSGFFAITIFVVLYRFSGGKVRRWHGRLMSQKLTVAIRNGDKERVGKSGSRRGNNFSLMEVAD